MEWQEMQERHGRELRELEHRQFQERLKLDPPKVVKSFDPSFYLADLNQVAISLVSTGLAAAIAKAVKGIEIEPLTRRLELRRTSRTRRRTVVYKLVERCRPESECAACHCCDGTSRSV